MALSRAWNVMHAIGPGSALLGQTAETLAQSEAEVTLSVAGIDDTPLQPVHATFTWMASDVLFGHRLADILSETADGNMLIDLRKLHDGVAA